MKKIFLLICGGLILWSCGFSETDDVRKISQSNEISFKTLRDKIITKQANDTSSDYQVYALASGSSDWYFSDVYNDDNQSTADAIHLWLGDTNITFYSFAPGASSYDNNSGITGVTTNAATPSVEISYKVPVTAGEDLTIATPQTLSTGVVAFQFMHVLSKITISVVLSDSLQKGGYTINDNYTASLTVNEDAGTINAVFADDASPSWSTSDNSGVATYSDSLNFIIMPQSVNGCKIELDGIQITGNGGIEVYKGSLLSYTFNTTATDDTASPISDFVMGKYYNKIGRAHV